MMSRYNDIPVSNMTKRGMTLNSDDQQFLKRMFDRQDEYITEYINEKDKRQMEFIQLILDEIKKIVCRIDSIEVRLDKDEDKLDDHEKRIKELENLIT
jgi:peptidoglycan hydrolase CwlO-like protein